MDTCLALLHVQKDVASPPFAVSVIPWRGEDVDQDWLTRLPLELFDDVVIRLEDRRDLVRFGACSKDIRDMTEDMIQWSSVFRDFNRAGPDLESVIYDLVIAIKGSLAPIPGMVDHISQPYEDKIDPVRGHRAKLFASTRTLEDAINLCDQIDRFCYKRTRELRNKARKDFLKRQVILLARLVRDVNPELLGAVIPTMYVLHISLDIEITQMLAQLMMLCPPQDPAPDLSTDTVKIVEAIARERNVRLEEIYMDPSGNTVEIIAERASFNDLARKVHALYPAPFNLVFPYNVEIAEKLLKTHPDLFVDVNTVRTFARYGIRFDLQSYISYVMDRDGQPSLPDSALLDVLPLVKWRFLLSTMFDDLHITLSENRYRLEYWGRFQAVARRLPFLLQHKDFVQFADFNETPDDIARCIVAMMMSADVSHIVAELQQMRSHSSHALVKAAADTMQHLTNSDLVRACLRPLLTLPSESIKITNGDRDGFRPVDRICEDHALVMALLCDPVLYQVWFRHNITAFEDFFAEVACRNTFMDSQQFMDFADLELFSLFDYCSFLIRMGQRRVFTDLVRYRFMVRVCKVKPLNGKTLREIASEHGEDVVSDILRPIGCQTWFQSFFKRV